MQVSVAHHFFSKEFSPLAMSPVHVMTMSLWFSLFTLNKKLDIWIKRASQISEMIKMQTDIVLHFCGCSMDACMNDECPVIPWISSERAFLSFLINFHLKCLLIWFLILIGWDADTWKKDVIVRVFSVLND